MFPKKPTCFELNLGGGSNPIFAHGKNVYGKRGQSIHFPLFPYTFFPFLSMGKNRKRHNFPMGKNWVRLPLNLQNDICLNEEFYY